MGVLLAAGAGTRFGMPKVLAGQGEWLRVAVNALAGGGCDEVVVVLGAAVVDVPPPARAVFAGDWADGMSASLRAGLAAAAGARQVVLHLVDTPDIGPDVVRRMLTAAEHSESGLVRASYGGRPGHPVVIAAVHWPELVGSLHGDQGARQFLTDHAGEVVVVECGDLATGADIDTLGDFGVFGSGHRD
ncbi:NTP transferase domain-containing protein [soil metagenome]